MNDKSKEQRRKKMSNKNLIVNTPEPKPGILERGDLFAIAVGMVIGSGMVTLIGPAMAMTGYSVWLAYLTAIVMGFFMVFPYIILGGTMRVAGGPYSIVTNLSGVSAGGLVAYEPTGNLDSKSGKIVIDALKDINEHMGKTIIMVTHDPQMASYCSRLILLKDGVILEDLKNSGDQELFYQEILGKMKEL